MAFVVDYSNFSKAAERLVKRVGPEAFNRTSIAELHKTAQGIRSEYSLSKGRGRGQELTGLGPKDITRRITFYPATRGKHGRFKLNSWLLKRTGRLIIRVNFGIGRIQLSRYNPKILPKGQGLRLKGRGRYSGKIVPNATMVKGRYSTFAAQEQDGAVKSLLSDANLANVFIERAPVVMRRQMRKHLVRVMKNLRGQGLYR